MSGANSGSTCRTRGVHRIELQMGRRGDMVRVKDKMPFPLVVYLGPGSDKFIGNAERDFCFPGGAGWDYCNGQRGWGKSHRCDSGPRR